MLALPTFAMAAHGVICVGVCEREPVRRYADDVAVLLMKRVYELWEVTRQPGEGVRDLCGGPELRARDDVQWVQSEVVDGI